eukprot:10105338-Karenia_brevis.AAC.1
MFFADAEAPYICEAPNTVWEYASAMHHPTHDVQGFSDIMPDGVSASRTGPCDHMDPPKSHSGDLRR